MSNQCLAVPVPHEGLEWCTRPEGHQGEHVCAKTGSGKAWPRPSSLTLPDGTSVPCIEGGGQFPTISARWAA